MDGCGFGGRKPQLEELWAKSISGGRVSYHFFWRRVLKPAGELLWSSVRRDELRNLEELAEGPLPQEPVSRQLWMLMSLGVSRPQLVASVKLLGEADWSTLAPEQQHGRYSGEVAPTPPILFYQDVGC